MNFKSQALLRAATLTHILAFTGSHAFGQTNPPAPAPSANPATPPAPDTQTTAEDVDELAVPAVGSSSAATVPTEASAAPDAPPATPSSTTSTPAVSSAGPSISATANPKAAAATTSPVSPEPPSPKTTDEATTTAVASDSKAAPNNLGAQFDLRPYSRPVVRGFGYGGFLQAQYLHSQLSEDQLQQGGAPFNRDQFALRSARLRLEQGYEYTAYGLELDATTTRTPILSIRRAEATVLYRGENPETNAPPLVALSVGVIDLPFGFEVAESVRTRLFMERTVASSALFPTQNDVGARLFGGWRFARYAFALVNGEPFGGSSWPTDPNSAKDLLGRLGAEGALSEAIALSGGASFAFGKGFHPGRAAVKDSLFWRDDNQDGIATSTEIVGIAGSSASPSSNFERFALGADLELQVATPIGSSRLYGEVYVASNHDRGLLVSDPVVTGVDVRQWGGYLALSQDITEYAIVALRAELYNPNADFFDQRRGEFVPTNQRIVTLSPAIGLILPRRARLLGQYDFVDDHLARNLLGVPTDARNNQWTLRLQVEL